MAKLVRIEKAGGGMALGRVGGKLITDTDGAPCCCGDCTGTRCLGTGAGRLQSFCVPTPTDYGRAFKYTVELISLIWSFRTWTYDPDGPAESRKEFNISLSGGKFSVSIAGQTVGQDPPSNVIRVCSMEDTPGFSDWNGFVRSVNSSGQVTQDDSASDGGPFSLKLSVLNSLNVQPGSFLDNGVNWFPRYPLIGFAAPNLAITMTGQSFAPCPGPSFEGQWASVGGQGGPYNASSPLIPLGGSRVTNFNGSPLNVTHSYSASLSLNLSNGNKSGFVTFGTSSSVSGRQNNVGNRFDDAASVSLIYRWTVDTLQACSASTSFQLPPGLDENGQPVKQPGQCYGCGQ